MVYSKYAALTVSLLVIMSMAGALQIQSVETVPGNTVNIAYNSTFNESNITGRFVNLLPFDTNVNATHIQAQVPNHWRPGDFNGSFTVSTVNNSESTDFTVTVLEDALWSVREVNVSKTESVGGERRRIGYIRVHNDGNTNIRHEANVSGNLSQYITIDPTTTGPATGSDMTIWFDADADTGYGVYRADVNVSGAGISWEKNFSISLQDDFKPDVSSVNAPGFMSTHPAEFNVTATDNIGVTNVSYKAFYTFNGSRHVLEQGNMVREDDSDVWSVTLKDATRTGDYTLNITVTDASGNTVRLQRDFSINPLDVVELVSDGSIQDYRTGSEVEHTIFSVGMRTPVDVTLTAFDQDLTANSTWKIGLVKPSGSLQRFHDGVNDSITVYEPGTYKLWLYGEEADVYAGDLRIELIETHVEPVRDLSFNGRMRNFTPIRDVNFTAWGQRQVCKADNDATINQSSLKCMYEIPAKYIRPYENVLDAVFMVIPKDAKQEQVKQYENVIREKAQLNAILLWVAAAGGLSWLFIGFYIFIWPNVYGLPYKDTERGM